MYYALILLILLLDQLTKHLIAANIKLNSSVSVIDSVFYLTYVHNYGAAFSILQNKKNFFIVVTVVVAAAMLIAIAKNRTRYHKALLTGFAMIAGGGAGNLADRIRYGYVIDFFDFRVWPVFNIADIFIVCGTALLVYYVIFIEPKISKKRNEC